MLTAPALLGPPAGACTPRRPWSFSGHISLSLSLTLLSKSSPMPPAQDLMAVVGRQEGIALLFQVHVVCFCAHCWAPQD